MASILFISDLHLAENRPGTVKLFLSFLAHQARKADALYILGDLFDAWIGDDDDSDVANQVREGLTALQGVTPVFFQHGNRDFLIAEQFCKQTGIEILPEVHTLQLLGQPTLLMHGDLLCTDDVEYQKARGFLRNPAFIHDFLQKPIAERGAIAAEMRRCSGETTSMLAADIMDVNPATVVQYMQDNDVTQLIHGHTHRPGHHQIDLSGTTVTRHVLADWQQDKGMALSAGSAGLVDLPIIIDGQDQE